MSQEKLFKVLLAPHVSEKSALIADASNQVTFKVAKAATKPEIKKAVELMFDVKVKAVSVVNMKGKKKRFGMRQGQRRSWKKAYITLEPGYDIDFLGTN